MSVGTKSGFGAVTIVTAIVGGAALVGSAGWGGLLGAMDLANTPDQAGSRTLSAQGVTSIDVDASAAGVNITFDDVTEIELHSNKELRGWTLRNDGGEVELRRNGSWLWWLDWFSPEGWGAGERVTLTLPRSLAGIDAELSVNAGSIDADADFGELDADVNAGDLTVRGSADVADIDVNTGSADAELDGVRELELSVSAGRLEADMASAPDQTSVDVSAGDLRLSLPDEEYQLAQNVSAGSLDSSLRETSSSPYRIDAEVSAGSATLRSHR